MTRPVGGRGHKAAYKTTVIRVPIDLKIKIDELIDEFHKCDLEVRNDSKTKPKKPDLKSIIDRYKSKSKTTRDWIKFNQLIVELEQELEQELVQD